MENTSIFEAYVPDASQRDELKIVIRDGVQPEDLSLMVVIRGGTDGTRRMLTEAITSAIGHKHQGSNPDLQVVYFCNLGGLIASTRGAIYISASCERHSCSEPCLAFMKSKGHPVLYIDCGCTRTETQRLLAEPLE